MLHAACWKYRTQRRRQKSSSGHHRTNLSGYIFATKARIDNRKKERVKQQYLLHMSSQYGELRLTNGWDWLTSLGHPFNFNGFRVLTALLAYCTALYWTSAKLCDVEQRAPPIFGRAAITLGIGPHSSFILFLSSFLLSFSFPRPFSAVPYWTSTILPHMVWRI